MKSECQHKWEKQRVCPDDCNVPMAGGVEGTVRRRGRSAALLYRMCFFWKQKALMEVDDNGKQKS